MPMPERRIASIVRIVVLHFWGTSGVFEPSGWCVLEMLDQGIGPREQERLVPTVAPAHEVRRTSVRAVDLDHLAVPGGLVDPVALDHDPIADVCLHEALLSPRLVSSVGLLGWSPRLVPSVGSLGWSPRLPALPP